MRQGAVALAKKLSIPIVWLLVHSCLPAKGETNDEAFRRCLIGTWTGEGIEKTFHDDGTATGALHVADNPGKVVTFKSRWRVENGRLLVEVLESSDSDALVPGAVFADKIVSITMTDFVFQNDYGQYDLRERVTAPSADCVIGNQAKMNDIDFAAKIVGTWVIDYGDGEHMEKTYRSDATSSGIIVEETTDGQQRTTFSSRWEVKDGYFLGEVLSSDSPTLPVGAKYTDKIVTITDQEFVTIEEGSRQVSVKHRKR